MILQNRLTVTGLILAFHLLLFSESVTAFPHKEQGKAHFSHKNYEKAKDVFLQIVQRYPGDGESWLYLAYIMENSEKPEPEKAIEYYKKALEAGSLSRKLVKIPLWKLIIYHQNRNESANTYYYAKLFLKYFPYTPSVQKILNEITAQKMWTMNKDAESSFNNGLKALQGNEYQKALAFFQDAYSRDGGFTAAKQKAAEILYAQRRFSEAESLFAEVIRVAPFQGHARFYLGAIQEKQGNCDAALQNLQEANRMLQDEKEFIQFHIPLHTSRCMIRMKNYDQAFAQLQPLLKRQPNHFDLNLLMGLVEQNRNKLDSAIYYFRQAASIKPNTEAVSRLYYLSLQKKNRESQISYALSLYHLLLKTPNSAETSLEKIPQRYHQPIADVIIYYSSQGKYSAIHSTWIRSIIQDSFQATIQELRQFYPRGPYLILAGYMFHQKDDNACIQLLSKEESAESHYLRAITFVRMDNQPMALQHLQNAITIEPSMRQRALKDPFFKSIREVEAFQKIIQ